MRVVNLKVDLSSTNSASVPGHFEGIRPLAMKEYSAPL